MTTIHPRGAVKHIERQWTRFMREFDKSLDRGLEKAGKTVLKAAIPYTPKDTEALRKSGRYEIGTYSEGQEVYVRFGGYNYPVSPTRNAPEGFVDYAGRVHEDMEPKNWTTPGTGPKFLEKAGNETFNQTEAILIENLRTATFKAFK